LKANKSSSKANPIQLITMSRQAFNFTPSAEQVKARREQLSKQRYHHIHCDDVRKMCQKILDVKNKTDIAFTFVQHLMDFSVLNKEEMNEQMKLWRNLAKEGKIQLYVENNMEYEVTGGEKEKKVYSLVITPTGDANFCPMSLAWGTMVSGFTYAFTKKENRDAVYAYVKKFCKEEDPRSDDEDDE
jgi:hypothetical protein